MLAGGCDSPLLSTCLYSFLSATGLPARLSSVSLGRLSRGSKSCSSAAQRGAGEGVRAQQLGGAEHFVCCATCSILQQDSSSETAAARQQQQQQLSTHPQL